AFAIERALRFGRPWRAAWLVSGAALGVMLSAAVWLPALHYTAASFRGGPRAPGIGAAQAARFSLAWRGLLPLVWPGAVGFGEATYWAGLAGTDHPSFGGVAVLILAASGMLRRGDRGTRTLLIAVAAFAVLASLGTTLGPIGFLLRHLVPL